MSLFARYRTSLHIAVLLPAALTIVCAEAPLIASQTVRLPETRGTVRLIVTGDAGGTHSQLRAGILALQKKTHLDGILLVGDNFYPCGVAALNDPQWSKITAHFGPAGLPIFAILGNHDYGDPKPSEGPPTELCGHPDPAAEVKASGRIPHWVLPARQYSLSNGLVDLIMIDSQPIASDWKTGFMGSLTANQEVQWLHDRLYQAKAPWKIVVGHHTMFSSGEHGRTNDRNQQNMRGLLPLLEASHADVYICGHDHDMELIGDPRSNNRPFFLISGAGSGLDEMKARASSSEPPTVWPHPIEKSFLGFALLEATAKQLSITFYDSAGNARSERFVATKSY